MLEGVLQSAEKRHETQKVDSSAAGKTMDELYPDGENSSFQTFKGNESGLDPKELIPGDRVWMENHKHDPNTDEAGYEGSNVIYLGRSTPRPGSPSEPIFLHLDGKKVETLSQLRQTVKGYSVSERQDRNILNYKIKEKYSPKVPSFN